MVLVMPKRKYKKKNKYPPQRRKFIWKFDYGQFFVENRQRKIQHKAKWKQGTVQILSLKYYDVYTITTTHLQLTTIKTWTIQSKHTSTIEYTKCIISWTTSPTASTISQFIHKSTPTSTMSISNIIDTKRFVW